MGLTIDFIEVKGSLIFAAGIALEALAVGDALTVVYEDGKSAKSRKQRGTVDLTIDSIIVDGEPVETAAANTTVLVALDGTWDALTDAADTLKWKRKSGRLLRTSDNALTLGN